MDWDESKRLVLYRLDELKSDIHHLSEQVDSLRSDVLRLKLQASMWGMLAGAIPGIIAIIVSLISGC